MGTKTKLLVVLILIFGVLLVTTCKDSSTGSDQPNQSPSVTFSITPTEGIMPHEVTVKVDGSDTDGEVASYHFDADGDGTAEITQSNPIDQSYTYEEEGAYQSKAWVSDDEGADSQQETVQVTVQTNKPKFTLEGQSFDLVEEETTSYDTSELVENGEITQANVISGPVNTELSNGSLELTPEYFSEASLEAVLELIAENENGQSTTEITLNLQGRTDLSGQLSTLGSRRQWQGKVTITDEEGAVIETIQTNADGSFQVQLGRSESYTLTANRVAGGDQDVYDGRTKTYMPSEKGADISATLRSLSHPSPETGVTPAQKRAYIEETNFRAAFVNEQTGIKINAKDEPIGGNMKWKRNSIKGVYIFKTNPETEDGASKGSFTEDERQIIADKLTSSEDVGACANVIDDDFQIVLGDESDHEAYVFDGAFTIANEGWIIVQADTTMFNFGGTSYGRKDDYIYASNKIRLNPKKIEDLTDAFEYVTSHEFIHAFSGFAEHTTTVPREKTIMQGGLHHSETRKHPELIDLEICKELNDPNLSAGVTMDKLF